MPQKPVEKPDKLKLRGPEQTQRNMANSGTEQRKLAAIIAPSGTDMVGYSALAQRNEALALELLRERRRAGAALKVRRFDNPGQRPGFSATKHSCALQGEWRLLKRGIFFGGGDASALAATPTVHVLAARFVQGRILGSLFDSSGFLSPRAQWHEVRG